MRLKRPSKSELIQRSAYESKYVEEDYFLYWCEENRTDIERKLPIYLTSLFKRQFQNGVMILSGS